MKKKIALILLSVLMVVSLGLFVACGEKGNGQSSLGFTYDDENHGYVVSSCDLSAVDVTIPSTYNNEPVIAIGNSAFYGCNLLESVDIPNSIKYIENNAFGLCRVLQNITIPDSVVSIGKYVFDGCSYLENITVGRNNLHYASQDGILYDKGKTEFICVPQAIIGSVTIPNTITIINTMQFCERTTLTRVVVGDNVKRIDVNAFDGCTSLSSVVFADSETWYYSVSYNHNYMNGTRIDVISSSDNATNLSDTYSGYYWYKK